MTLQPSEPRDRSWVATCKDIFGSKDLCLITVNPPRPETRITRILHFIHSGTLFVDYAINCAFILKSFWGISHAGPVSQMSIAIPHILDLLTMGPWANRLPNWQFPYLWSVNSQPTSEVVGRMEIIPVAGSALSILASLVSFA